MLVENAVEQKIIARMRRMQAEGMSFPLAVDVAEFGQLDRVVFSSQNGPDDVPAREPADIADHLQARQIRWAVARRRDSW